jgi:hypothetical protein
MRAMGCQPVLPSRLHSPSWPVASWDDVQVKHFNYAGPKSIVPDSLGKAHEISRTVLTYSLQRYVEVCVYVDRPGLW